MMRTEAILLMGFLLCGGPACLGAEPLASGGEAAPAGEAEAAREILARLDRRLEGVKTMRGRFIQTFSSSGLGIPQSEEGRFALRRPDRTRWEYISPEKKIAVSDGVSTWLYLPEESVVYRGSVASWKRSGAFAALAGGRLGEGFEAVAVDPGGASRRENVVLTLRPRTPRDDFQELLVEIEPGSLKVAAIVAVDAMGNRIGIAFSGVEENVSLPEDLFRFAPPPGVRVLDQDPGATGP